MILPIVSTLECQPRQYVTVEYRPLTDSGMQLYGEWLGEQTWNTIYGEINCHKKTELFHDLLMSKFYEIFPMKSMKVCPDDQPWFSRSLKILDRRRKREFYKNNQSQKWQKLDTEFVEKCKNEKAN